MNIPPWVYIGVLIAIIFGIWWVFFRNPESKELATYHEYKIEPDADLSEIKHDMKKMHDKLVMLEQLSITNANKIKALQLGQGIRQEQMGYLSGTTAALTQAFLDNP